MALEQIANNAQTTLAAVLDESATTLTVTDASRFPGSPQFRIAIENELLLVTFLAGATWSVTRGIEGTTASSHASSSTVSQVLTSQGLRQLLSDSAASVSNTTFTGTAGETITITEPTIVGRDAVGLLGTAGEFWKFGGTADGTRTFPDWAFAIANTSGTLTLVPPGRQVSGFTGLSAGLPVWADPSTPGAITQTAPSLPTGTDYQAHLCVGNAISSTTIQTERPAADSWGMSWGLARVIAGNSLSSTDNTMFYQYPGAMNDEVEFVFDLQPGNYSLTVLHSMNSNTGIITFTLDGAVVGTLDCYAGTYQNWVKNNIAVAVIGNGKHTLRCKIASKNALSTGYYAAIQTIGFTR